tara:strand:- start:13635 stop:13829 length:195 start_codon:yes stop_codon:yes gene_type:complete
MNKLTLYHKMLIVIYIIAIPIPFALTIILFIYSILYYVFKLPLRQEKYILLYVAKKLKNLCNKK